MLIAKLDIKTNGKYEVWVREGDENAKPFEVMVAPFQNSADALTAVRAINQALNEAESIVTNRLMAQYAKD